MNAARILIVEDDADNGRSLLEAIGDLGYEAELAATGTAGVDAFRAQGADVVLTDLVLPDEQYCQLIELLKYADTGTNRSIRVWFSKGKAEFEYFGVRYASLEQLKKHADLQNDFTVHLMRKVSSDECRKLYQEMNGMGFRIEDVTAPFDNGLRGSVLPEKS